MWKAIKDGVIDLVVTDHSPAPISLKQSKDLDFSNSKAIIEAFKEDSIEEIRSKNLSLGQGYDRFTKFKRFY